MTMSILLWIVGTYLIASIPFSVLIGHLILDVDIRQYGDGNPGATNVKRASDSIPLYALAVFLDGAKGLFPVGIAYHLLGWNGLEIVPIAWAALLGHSFSIFLKFKGGKSVAITGGTWIGLLLAEAILVVPTLLVYWFYTVEENDWAVVLWVSSFLLYLLLTHSDQPPLLLICGGNIGILAYKHRASLHKPPTIRRWIPFLSNSDNDKDNE